MDDNTIFFQVQVISNQDPMMLGRIRAKLLIQNDKTVSLKMFFVHFKMSTLDDNLSAGTTSAK